MVVEFEDKYCKAGEIFERMTQQLEADCEKEVPVHEAEEHLWEQVLRMGREMLTRRERRSGKRTFRLMRSWACRRETSHRSRTSPEIPLHPQTINTTPHRDLTRPNAMWRLQPIQF